MEFQVEEVGLLGKGAFGQVFLVKDPSGRQYALKKVKIDPFMVEEGLKEIELMSLFTHPNLVKIHGSEFDETNFQLNILMEYCEQGDLLSYFKNKNKSLNSQEILTLLLQIVHGFLVLNSKGVIHRDLKPENVLIGSGIVAKIADFGCARSVIADQFSHVNNLSLDKGTRLYASPQQLSNDQYSAKCDVWSAGCLLYFIAIGQHPFLDKNRPILEVIKELTEEKTIELPKGVHPNIAEGIRLTLQFHECDRATWRELWLSRIFKTRVRHVREFVQYLSYVATISNWLVKSFWKHRKEVKLAKHRDQTFVYFISKFQYSALGLALAITSHAESCRYLFEDEAFDNFQASKELIAKLKRIHQQNQSYFVNIKNYLKDKDIFKVISKQSARQSCFADLDNSIRAAYKILTDVRSHVKETSDPRVWVVLSRWLNFDIWFSFEAAPRIQNLLNEEIPDPEKALVQEMTQFETGLVDKK